MKYLLLLLFPMASRSQSFFVSGNDKYSVRKCNDKIRFEGYQTTEDSAHADYIANLLIDGSYKVVSFNYSYHGYIMITDRKTGKEVGRTKVVGANPAALNGYNAAYTIFNHIDKKYLPALLKNCPKNSPAAK